MVYKKIRPEMTLLAGKTAAIISKREGRPIQSKIDIPQEFSPPLGGVVSSININYSYTQRHTIHLRMCVSVFLSCKSVAG